MNKIKFRKNAVQYFSFKVIEKIELDCGVTDYYLKKYENKIGIIHEGQDYFFMNYLENNEEASSMLFEYESEEQQDGDSSSSFDRQLEYCFCGKLEYLFYNQLAGKIIQCNLKNTTCKTYNFEKRTLNLIKAIKNTNFIILNWNGEVNNQSVIEIRDSANLEIKNIFQYFYGIPRMIQFIPQKSQIVVTAQIKLKIHSIGYFQIRDDKYKRIMSFYRKMNSEMIGVDNNLIFESLHQDSFKLVSLILKGKILRKLSVKFYKNKCSLKKYNDYYFLKMKSKNWVGYQIYQWWKGSLVYSSIIKKLLNEKITSREAKGMVYILKYEANIVMDKQLKPQIPKFQSPVRPYLDRYSIF